MQWLAELKLRYRNQQLKASVQVNRALIVFYWELGRDIVERDWENVYGSGFFGKLSADLKKKLDSPEGFSENNLRYMRAFYRLYAPCFQNLQQPVGESTVVWNNGIFSMPALISIRRGCHVRENAG